MHVSVAQTNDEAVMVTVTSRTSSSALRNPVFEVCARSAKEPEVPDLGEIMRKAGKRALGGGIPGAAAMGIQVLSLMWLRTTVNYQYRYGMSTTQALKTLYAEGGVRRFYQGVVPALLQGPLSRFGDTAANTGVLAFMDAHPNTKDLPVGVKTLAASAAAGIFRVYLMPVDAMKTIMQVEGKNGLQGLGAREFLVFLGSAPFLP